MVTDRSLPPRSLLTVTVLGIGLAPLLFFTNLTENPYFIQIVVLQWVVSAAVWIYAGEFFRFGSIPWRQTPLDKPLLVVGLWFTLTTLLALQRHPAFFRPAINNEGLRGTVFLWANVLAPFFLATQWDRKDSFLFRILVSVGGIAALYGVFQYAGIDPFWGTGPIAFGGRPISTFGNPNFLSTALALLLPCALREYLSATRRRTVVFWGAVILLYLGALLSTLTRSSWIGAFVGCVVFGGLTFSQIRQWPRRWLILFSLGGLLLFLWPRLSPNGGTSVFQRLAELWSGVVGTSVYGSWHQRLLIWSAAWDLWRDSPWVGKGWGLFELFFPFAQARWLGVSVFRDFRTHANNAHQLVLEIGSQTGLIGLGLTLWAATVAVGLFRRRIGALPEDKKTRVFAYGAGLTAVVVDNTMGNVSLFFATPSFLTFWVLGQMTTLLNGVPTTIQRTRRTSAILLTLSVLGMALAAQGVRQLAAEIFHLSGLRAQEKSNDRRAEIAFTRSRQCRPRDVRNAFALGNLYARQSRSADEQGLSGETRDRALAALEAYTEALRANPGYDEIHVNRAAQWTRLGVSTAAFNDLRFGLQLNPLQPPSYDAFVGAPDSMGDDEKILEQAVQFYPLRQDYWAALGRIRERAGQTESAGAAYERALRLDLDDRNALAGLKRCRPKSPAGALAEALSLLAEIRRQTHRGDLDRSLVLAAVLERLIPEYALTLLIQGDLCAKKERWREAEGFYRSFLERVPGHREARLNLIHTLNALGRREETRAWRDSLRADFPADPTVLAILEP